MSAVQAATAKIITLGNMGKWEWDKKAWEETINKFMLKCIEEDIHSVSQLKQVLQILGDQKTIHFPNCEILLKLISNN